MPLTVRHIALLLLMLTLPFHGWALAFASACESMSSAPVMKHLCCAEKKACAEHSATQSQAQKTNSQDATKASCGDGATCQCSNAVSMLTQPLIVSARLAPRTAQIDFDTRMVYSQSTPPFRPPIHS